MAQDNAKDNEKKNPGPLGPGEPGTGPEYPAAYEERKSGNRKSCPHTSARTTALTRRSAGLYPERKRVRRRQTASDIYRDDPEIPYRRYEEASFDLICSLMERQDRMNEAIFNRIIDLEYRVWNLEEDRKKAGGAI